MKHEVIVGSPELARQVFLNTKEISKTFAKFNPHFSKFLGDLGILFSNGERWKKQRSIIDKAFVSLSIANCFKLNLELYFPIFAEKTNLFSKQPIINNLQVIMHRLTLVNFLKHKLIYRIY